ncbi:hypothetical protein SDC9_182382 [bioreactor metagenome]|uniref:Uncharacterized protein n=1 Tax=bioreactor metagenome TaxID=1076179 RepID=A0A645H7D9_9ZZZZ
MKLFHDSPGQLAVIRVDDHTVGDAGQKALHMAGAHPYRKANGLRDALAHHLCQAFAALFLQPFHAQDKGLARNRVSVDAGGKFTQMLC